METSMSKIVLGIAAAALALGGCASKEYVHEYVAGAIKPVNERIDGVEKRVAGTEGGVQSVGQRVDGVDAALKDHGERIAKNEAAIAELSKTAKEALDRATAAGKLAEGKFVQEVVLTDDQLRFGNSKAVLSKEAKAVLDDFAKRLKDDNKNVYIEIQGHTDSRGEEPYNLKLGEERANAVRHYLNASGGLPLHRMSVISYGESKPVADNKVRAGREQNRRVTLVVLK
jgi:outer membrane protein OmpA-like peptidoglycan-associated protein